MNSIDLNRDINELYTLTKFINDLIQKSDFQIDLMIEEIFVNIVNYSDSEFIRVNAEFEDSMLTMEFIDDGIPFNPLLKEDPDIPTNINETPVGGLGIFLTKNIADEISYHYADDKNHLKIIKKVE